MTPQYFSPITEFAYTNNTTANTSTYVRVYNGHTAAHLIAINDAVNNVTIGTVTIGSTQEAFIKKEPNHQVNVAAAAGSGSVKIVGVDF
jgi:hypothetical protein